MNRISTIMIGFSLLMLTQSNAFAQQTVKTVSHTANQSNYMAANDNGATTKESNHKPFNISVLTGSEANSIDLSYSPSATDFVTLIVKPGNYQNMSLRLFTEKGRVIADQRLSFGQSTIMLPDYSSPLYTLSIYNDNKEVKTFKIIKNR